MVPLRLALGLSPLERSGEIVGVAPPPRYSSFRPNDVDAEYRGRLSIFSCEPASKRRRLVGEFAVAAEEGEDPPRPGGDCERSSPLGVTPATSQSYDAATAWCPPPPPPPFDEAAGDAPVAAAALATVRAASSRTCCERSKTSSSGIASEEEGVMAVLGTREELTNGALVG